MEITIKVNIQAPIEKVWKCWTEAENITQWNFASDDWCCPSATNELKPGGQFNWRMEAKDGSIGFDFTGTYDQVKDNELITYKMTDGRAVTIRFTVDGEEINLTETFDAEDINSHEQQRAGWQAILQNFKKYVESKY